MYCKNEGLADTDDVVQVYIKDWKSKYAVRNYHLCAFKRVHLNAGEKETFEIEIDKDALQIVDEEGKRYIDVMNFLFILELPSRIAEVKGY